MAWFRKTNLDYIKRIDKELHAVASQLSDMQEVFRRKLRIFRRLNSDCNKSNIAEISREINNIQRLLGIDFKFERKELSFTSDAVKKIEKIVDDDFSRDRAKKQLKYQEYKNLINLKHLIENYSRIIAQQLNFFETNKTPEAVKRNIQELSRLFHEESNVIGLEREPLKVLETETEELEKQPFDVTLIGYGSLMRASQIGVELKKTLGESVGLNINQKIKERAVPVLVYGWKRIFDKAATRGVWETEEDKLKKRLAAMDIHPSAFHYFNAVAIKLTNDEFKAFIEREKSYGTIELKDVRHFVTGERLKERCICFKSETFRLRKEGDIGPFADRLTRYELTPIPKYFSTCVIGAKGLDSILNAPGMYATFLKTTYLYYYDEKRVYHGEITVFELIQIRNKQRALRREMLAAQRRKAA